MSTASTSAPAVLADDGAPTTAARSSRVRIARIARATVLALALSTACSKSDTTAPPITLTQAEVAQLFNEVNTVLEPVNLGFSVTSGVGAGPRFPVVPGPSFSVRGPINQTVSCPSGGNATVVGSTSGTTTITFDVTASFNACRTTNYTVGGSFRFFGTATSTTLQLTVQGTLTVNASGGRSGSCTMNFTVSVSGTSTSVTGTICGVNASGTIT